MKDRFDELKLLLKNEKDIEQFKKYLRDALKGYPKYTIRPDLSYISRNNKYESVTNFASLAALV